MFCTCLNGKNIYINGDILKKLFFKTLLTIILFLITLIFAKNNNNFKKWLNDNIYDKTLSFTNIAMIYKRTFGSSMPFKEILPVSEPVFNEKLQYEKSQKYLDGVSLTVSNNYLVPSLKKGLVIFIGEKSSYGLCVIVQQVDNVETMYCNINNVAIKLYDYIDSGMLIGEVTDNKLIMAFKQNNKFVDYEAYI